LKDWGEGRWLRLSIEIIAGASSTIGVTAGAHGATVLLYVVRVAYSVTVTKDQG
jgi:hypothetical protein